jgi:hypothetical protein
MHIPIQNICGDPLDRPRRYAQKRSVDFLSLGMVRCVVQALSKHHGTQIRDAYDNTGSTRMSNILQYALWYVCEPIRAPALAPNPHRKSPCAPYPFSTDRAYRNALVPHTPQDRVNRQQRHRVYPLILPSTHVFYTLTGEGQCPCCHPFIPAKPPSPRTITTTKKLRCTCKRCSKACIPTDTHKQDVPAPPPSKPKPSVCMHVLMSHPYQGRAVSKRPPVCPS